MEKLVVIAGTNASGKSSLGIELALNFNAEIISADSRQVFKGLDLGSGKVTVEEMKGVPHFLIDVAEPGDFFSLYHYQKLAYEAIDGCLSRGSKAFLVGGTGLYVNSVADGYRLNEAVYDASLRKEIENKTIDELIQILKERNPDALDRVDLMNKRRLERAAEKALTGQINEYAPQKRYETLIIGVTWPREILYERIKERLDRRLDEGMIDEVRNLRLNGASDEFLYSLGLEYRYILMYLRGEFADFDAFYNKLYMEIRHLAKEQMTWFRKRDDIKWISMDRNPYEEAKELIDEFYKK